MYGYQKDQDGLLSVHQHFINFAKYQASKGSYYVELSKELNNPMKGLINLHNRDNECSRWCHIRHLNPQNKDPQRVKKTDKEFISQLHSSNVQFPVSVKDYHKVKKKNTININVFGYENSKPFPFYVSKERYNDVMNLLLIKDHYVLIYDFNRFMYNQTNTKKRNTFACIVCNVSLLKKY